MDNDEHMSREDFVALANEVLEAHGTMLSSAGCVRLYEDDIILIRSNFGGLGLEVERKARLDPENEHLRVSNPVTMVLGDGTIIRHHGEHAYLVGHLKALAGSKQKTA